MQSHLVFKLEPFERPSGPADILALCCAIGWMRATYGSLGERFGDLLEAEHDLQPALTRFANNYIHQNVEETDTSITVRAVLGKKIGVATTDVVTPEGLKAMR